MSPHYHFIINPVAGSGHAKIVWPKLRQILQTRNISYSFDESRYPGHTEKLCRQYALNHPQAVIVLLGGDGTLHEAVNGLHKETKVSATLAYIPCGSGNDFARGLSIPADPVKALDKILAAKAPRLVDIGHYTEKFRNESAFFTNNIGIGFDAQIVYLTNHSPLKRWLNKYHLGFLSYAALFFKALKKQPTFKLEVTNPKGHQVFEQAFLCTTTNHPYFGGGVNLMPTAKINDGKLDLVVIEKKRTWPFLRLFLLMILPGHFHIFSRRVHHLQAPKLKLAVSSAEHGQADGEEMGTEPFEISFSINQQAFLY
ncbi:diacylglycerol/lipid kinase family protein [Ligilactobacillus agilis]|uniref:diacylglycerol/lipid kinase family protein n=1 Tax=Ligilactobacillus agilis TaxID=1601 RepID=UPI000B8DB4AF|nr:diacylglycerol kinase family protein [Ligilactobacillus agilis]ASR41197.1 hypothetical protein BEN83_06800 [Ligilactobacillus agilis]